MPTVINFATHASSGNGFFSVSNAIDVEATGDDGIVSVGDEVTISAQNGGNLSGHFGDADIPASGVAYYLGSLTLDGKKVYVFGKDPVFANNTEFMGLYDVSADNSDAQSLRAWANDTSTQALVSEPACFLSGTLISTPEGARPVEELAIGDAVLTPEGATVAVKWVGRQVVSTRFGPAERLMPVRFASGSLGDGLPDTDLTVTADHGMLVDGVICHAGALVNGTTITRVPLAEMGESFTVYHIETEAHEIILANGAPAETFIDNVSRRVFDNFAEFEALYGEVPEMEELPYPRVMSARQVPGRIRVRLAAVQAA